MQKKKKKQDVTVNIFRRIVADSLRCCVNIFQLIFLQNCTNYLEPAFKKKKAKGHYTKY